MSYRVTWLLAAQDAMLQILLSRPNRADLVNALDRIGATLQREGPEAGESREEGLRVLFELPLGVTFSVLSPESEVIITDVWVIAR